jgi:hypothetical protein
MKGSHGQETEGYLGNYILQRANHLKEIEIRDTIQIKFLRLKSIITVMTRSLEKVNRILQ